MNPVWQNLLVASIVVAAAAYVAGRLWRWGTRKPTGCWHCKSCSSAAKPSPLVSITPAGERNRP